MWTSDSCCWSGCVTSLWWGKGSVAVLTLVLVSELLLSNAAHLIPIPLPPPREHTCQRSSLYDGPAAQVSWKTDAGLHAGRGLSWEEALHKQMAFGRRLLHIPFPLHSVWCRACWWTNRLHCVQTGGLIQTLSLFLMQREREREKSPTLCANRWLDTNPQLIPYAERERECVCVCESVMSSMHESNDYAPASICLYLGM